MEGLVYQEQMVASEDGTKLATWYFPTLENVKKKPELVFAEKPTETRAIVVQFHGNAENMTTHYRFLSWLPFNGYDLLTFDYRGYGQSVGKKNITGIFSDVKAMLHYADQLASEKHLPLIVYGQSLGGSLLLRALQETSLTNLKLIVIESSFWGYQMIAREKLAGFWLTWPFQWLAYLLVSDHYRPGGKGLEKLPPVPKVLIYSEHDPVVPINHGEELFRDLKDPKYFWKHSTPGHVNAMFVEQGKYREELLAMMKAVTARADRP